MKLKRILAGITCMAMVGSLAGCGAKTEEEAKANAETMATTEAAKETEAGNSDAGDGSAETVAEAAGQEEDVSAKLAALYGDETIQLTVYSQLANYSGKLTGWFAQLMKEKYNCEITIIPDSEGMFDTRMESGNLGDIVIFGSNGEQYQRAATGGMLFDWQDDGLLDEYGSYCRDNMPYALQRNKDFNAELGVDDAIYGFGHNVATSTNDHEAFFYTMDLRWDLYKQLGYPTISSLDDLNQLFLDMKEICPTDENGNEAYALSMWPDWDGNMVMYVKAFATCYWGYDEMGFGLYDVEDGTYHDALEEDGPYLKALKFFNKLFQENLIDPNSMTQTYDQMSDKVRAGGVYFSIFDYAGSQLYNSENHVDNGTGMYPLVPSDATPLCYGMNVLGGNRIWSIGANTEYPELCMAIINYLCTPEGYLTYWYGPKGLCWDYDESGNTILTEFGETCYKDKKGTVMPDEWGGGYFNDGTFQANNTTWSLDASNPDSTADSYNCENWISRRVDTEYEMLKDWRDMMGCYNSQEYMDSVNHKVALATSYTESKRSDDLELIWNQVKTCIVNYSWQAIYAETDEDYEAIVAEMRKKRDEYDPNGECLQWCYDEAAKRCALEDEVR